MQIRGPGAGALALGLMLLVASCAPSASPSAPSSDPPPGAGSRNAAVRPPSRGVQGPAALVNPFVGTIRDGNVFPGAAAPFGMVQWSPDTSAGGLSMPGGYNYGDTIIRGFSLTHLSGAGCAAFGNVPLMPVAQQVSVPPAPNGSPYSTRFSHLQERASPGFYGVRLGSGVAVELAVTQRTGLGRFTYPSTGPAGMVIDVGGGAGAKSNVDGADNAAVRITGANQVTGWARSGHFCGLSNRYTVYFAARFDHPFSRFGTWNASGLHPGRRLDGGRRSGAFVEFDRRQGSVVQVKVGLSYVGVRNALANLQAEDPGWSFATVRNRATATWNRVLDTVQATGGAPADEQTFYTALYHAFLHPNVFSDANGQYAGFDGRVHLARGYTQYANFSGWDIYRSEIQLLAWLLPGRTGDMLQSLVADAEQGGWLPKWPVANDYTGEMDGDPADPVIAGAWAFGARHFDAGAALRFMRKGASQPGHGPRGYQERPQLADYLRLGYVPPATGGWGAAAQTLEYAVDDFSIAQLAGSLGEAALSRAYLRRAQSWRSLFNPATGFIEPRFPGGTFPVRFDPGSMDGFVEGNAWQYTWMVPQDLGGLFRLMGGNRSAVWRLDAFFTHLQAGPGAPYHWAGNEPGLEVPWEYDFAGAPWRTQAVVRRILSTVYADRPDGLPGNDDLGELSSWYVWAAMGLYPEIPGAPGLAVGSPLFPRIRVRWGGGHRLSVLAPTASAGRPYVQSLTLNGHPYARAWLPLSALAGDARLHFQLGSRPHTSWGLER